MKAVCMSDIVVLGSGGHAKVLADAIEMQGLHRIVGWLDRFRSVGEQFLGREVLGSEDDLPALVASRAIRGVIVAIGDNFARAAVSGRIRAIAPALQFITVVHPSAVVARDATLGLGSVVLAGAVIGASARVGEGCIVNTKASLDHDSVMDAFSSLAPGVTTGGNCRVGTCSAVSIGATVLHKVQIGAHCVVGAGAVLTRSLEDAVVAYGVPAKVMRTRQPGDPYL